MKSPLIPALALAASLAAAEPVQQQTDEFAIQMFSTLATTQKGNIVFSPSGTEAVLHLLRQGAAGETAKELEALPLGKQGVKTTIKPQQANALFVSNELELNPGINKKQVRRVPFKTAPDKAVKAINKWAKQKTKGRITKVLTKDDVSADTRLIAANAIYLKAIWWYPFDREFTQENTRFTLADGSTTTVTMMKQQAYFTYVEGEAWQAVALFYKPDDDIKSTKNVARTHFIGILPKGDAREFARRLTAETYQSIRAALAQAAPQDTIVCLPRFTIKTKTFSLKDALSACGVKQAFSASGNFSGFTGSQLQLSDIVQRCYININESGTEAAAVTEAFLEEGCIEEDEARRTKVINFDRPFIWVITDLETPAAPFFMGLLEQP